MHRKNQWEAELASILSTRETKKERGLRGEQTMRWSVRKESMDRRNSLLYRICYCFTRQQNPFLSYIILQEKKASENYHTREKKILSSELFCSFLFFHPFSFSTYYNFFHFFTTSWKRILYSWLIGGNIDKKEGNPFMMRQCSNFYTKILHTKNVENYGWRLWWTLSKLIIILKIYINLW